jgi:hypothetical protein
VERKKVGRLETPTSPTTLPPGRVRGGRGDVLNTSDPHSRTGQTTESGLSSRSGLLGSGSSGSSELDVEGGDTDFLASGGDVLGSQHGGVRLAGAGKGEGEDVRIACIGLDV